MHPLTSLVCGDPITAGTLSEVQKHLSDTLDTLLVRLVKLKKDANPSDMALFGPLIARALLETAFTALTARFDPSRVLAIRKSQLSPSYDLATRNQLAYNWAYDVLGEKPKKWEDGVSTRELSRALLGKHFDDLFWQEAFQNFLDDYKNPSKSTWVQELVKFLPEDFIPRTRGNVERTYSELSKGIHFEFVIPLISKFDVATIEELMNTSCQLVGYLSLTAAYSTCKNVEIKNNPIKLLEEAQVELKV